MGLRGGVWARPILASALALGLAPGAHAWMIIGLSPGYHNQARPIHPAPAVWRTASLGRPGPAAPDWPRPAIVIRDARGDTKYRWGLVPGGLARSGAFLDATVWPTLPLAARHNAQARAESARGEGRAVLPLLPLGGRAAVAPSAWARGYVTSIHCTLVAGETYRNVQFTLALDSDHAPRTCALERGWVARALRLLWRQADAYARARRS